MHSNLSDKTDISEKTNSQEVVLLTHHHTWSGVR